MTILFDQASDSLGPRQHNVSLGEEASQAFKGDGGDNVDLQTKIIMLMSPHHHHQQHHHNDDYNHDDDDHEHQDHHQVSVSGKGGLKIKTIGFKDSGIYTCMGQNTMM